MKETIVIGLEVGQNATKAHLVWVSGKEVFEASYLQPTLAVAAPRQADEGEPLQRLTLNEKVYLIGDSALRQSPDAIYQTNAKKIDEPRRSVIRLCFMGVLAWAATMAPILEKGFRLIVSHPDSEWEDEKDDLRAVFTGVCQFSTGAPVVLQGGGKTHMFNVDVQPEQVSVARESVAAWYAHTLTPIGLYRSPSETPLLALPGGAKPLTLLAGLGFRDGNIGKMDGKQRLESRSWLKGVELIYQAIYDALRAKPVSYTLRSFAEVEMVLHDRSHPIWSHRQPELIENVIRQVVRERGRALLAEAWMWAGDVERYHCVLASGGGSLLLRELIQEHFAAIDTAGRLIFSEQGDGARGLAYLGVYGVRQGAK